VTALRILFLVSAVVWVVLGAVTLARMASGSPEQASVAGVLAALMAAYALVLCFIAWSLGKRKKVFYYFAIAVSVLTILLTFTDQVGLADLIGLALAVAPLVLLIAARRWYLSA
jgi:presenilin-like A22 family membrane protease